MDTLAPFAKRLEELRRQELLRTLRPVERCAPGRVQKEGRMLLDFSSNDYLGLLHHPALRLGAENWLNHWGAGSGASRLVAGTSSAIGALEERLAHFKGTERALIFCSGFQANSTVLAALLDSSVVGREPLVYCDRLVHASIHFGCAAAGVREIRFRHNDLDHLRELLKKDGDKKAFRIIAVESVYSMDGDRCDLRALRALADEAGAFLFVDEAHSSGVMGPNGAGLVAEAGVRADCVMGTFSKAFGSAGAYVACGNTVANYLVTRCAGFIFSTGLSPAVLGAIEAALELMPHLENERVSLAKHSHELREWLSSLGLSTMGSSTQIIPVLLGEPGRALRMARALEREGILAPAIRSPTVPEGQSRIRLSLCAAHGDDDLAALRSALEPLLTAGFLPE